MSLVGQHLAQQRHGDSPLAGQREFVQTVQQGHQVFEITGEAGQQIVHDLVAQENAATVGVAKLRRADPEFVRAHTGQVIGGVSPLAHPRPLRTWLDGALGQYDEIWAAAGHPHTVFRLTPDALVRITGGQLADTAQA